uniref:TSA: Wollemia nobilis Ref_Wollemi_Transcript_10203_2362 transcribed RNA sequence n=1 Tax=Wollemia nobilis TaxID=56998 RepID=A0A0C9S6Z3_9CONI
MDLLLPLVLIVLAFTATSSAGDPFLHDRNLQGTVAFASVGRAHYAFDIYSLPLQPLLQFSSLDGLEEEARTDGESVNYNGQFLSGPGLHTLAAKLNINTTSRPVESVMTYVSERNGFAEVYLNIYFHGGTPFLSEKMASGDDARREALERGISAKNSVTINLGSLRVSGEDEGSSLSMQDRPNMAGDDMVYVWTRRPSRKSRKSWAAVYATSVRTGQTRRLTPRGIADFSPAVSPSGEWIAVASEGRRGWQGEIHDLETDLYIFRASDGSDRRLLLKHSGWPSWADEETLFFHRQTEDGWWSVYRVSIFPNSSAERITPPGVHAFTPAASRTGPWLAVATRRPDSEYRHIEMFDLVKKEFVEVTRLVSPHSHHYNPFVSAERIGYHRCRGGDFNQKVPVLEHLRSPLPHVSLFRIDGTFPSFSPDGSKIVYIPNIEFSGVYVMRLDGSHRRKIFSGPAFGTAWDWKRGVVYTSAGPGFETVRATVNIIAIYNADKEDDSEISYRTLTKVDNNAFPSPSPDGKFVVFRSGRSGYKNLYIMDAEQGEDGGLWQLTEGPWTDTMCNWSPDGEWIAFASDRDNPGSGSFAMYFVHPNGTGLHRVLNSSTAGRVNHPWFSPDSKSLVFTSDYAGVSAEPISVPHQFQPYGEIFMAKVGGSDVRRLTHNSYEDGTPSWGRVVLDPSDLAGEGENVKCDFDDDSWLETENREAQGSMNC